MRRARSGERGPVWIRADRQISGRGRSGRAWSSPGGNLSATLLFTPGAPIEALSQLSLLTGVAVVDAVHAAFVVDAVSTPDGLRVKWPNDVLIGDAKLAGILIETTAFEREIVVAVGCGLNILVAPPVEGRAVTWLAEHGIAPSPGDFLRLLSDAMSRWLGVWDVGRNFGAVRAGWLERAGPLGAEISIKTGENVVRGRFQGLDPEGALLLADPAGNVRRFHYGDVT